MKIFSTQHLEHAISQCLVIINYIGRQCFKS